MRQGLVIQLTFGPGVGWNFGLILDGRPLPAGDRLNADSVETAYQAALVTLNAEMDRIEDEERRRARQ
ncbi:hypothetical protein ACKVEX_05495 [Rhodocyclaceae bacterium SMB388]